MQAAAYELQMTRRKGWGGAATEDDIQRAIMRFLESVTDPDRVIAFHIPNGGARSKTEAAIMKGLGVLAGAADISISWWNSHYNQRPFHGFLEVKTETGRPSPAQIEFRRRCDVLEIPYRIVRSVDDVAAFLDDEGIPNRTSSCG